ncbi:helix-turn-helix domain-containing protein [Aquimarina muelleri]
MTITAILGDYQAIEQSTMNFGLTAVIATHIHEFIVQRREEAFVLAQLHVKQDNIQIQIAKEIIENILIKFEKFEKEERYLKGKVTLGLLAKKWKTNSKYLSHIVNTHKGKSFTQYVNDLRIAYFKKRIIVDEEFRNYTLKAMAKELGYTSTGTFVNAFYKKERIKLFDYIQKVRSNFRNHP